MIKFAVQKQAAEQGIPPRTPYTPANPDGSQPMLTFNKPMNNDLDRSPSNRDGQSPQVSGGSKSPLVGGGAKSIIGGGAQSPLVGNNSQSPVSVDVAVKVGQGV